MGVLASFLKDLGREVLAASAGVEIRDRIKELLDEKDSKADSSRYEFLTFIQLMDKEDAGKMMSHYTRYLGKNKKEADRFVKLLGNYLIHLRNSGLAEEKIRELFKEIANSTPDDLEARLQFLEGVGLGDILKNFNQKLENALDPIIEQLEKSQEKRRANRYAVK